jgi:hypothetical protein
MYIKDRHGTTMKSVGKLVKSVLNKKITYNLQDSGAKPSWVEAASEYECNAENKEKDLTKDI